MDRYKPNSVSRFFYHISSVRPGYQNWQLRKFFNYTFCPKFEPNFFSILTLYRKIGIAQSHQPSDRNHNLNKSQWYWYISGKDGHLKPGFCVICRKMGFEKASFKKNHGICRKPKIQLARKSDMSLIGMPLVSDVSLR